MLNPDRMNNPQVNIPEDDIPALGRDVITELLKDHTTNGNIFWAADYYAGLGKGYQYADPITVEAISGENSDVIVPRALKSRHQQQQRVRAKAEVFTPSWMCNKQNNLVDSAWFGRKDVFNSEVDNHGISHTWIPTEGRIVFPKGHTWRQYINDNRLEIACGEAPYLTSRYDAVTGETIAVERRIGLLDRKLRVASEHAKSRKEWIELAKAALRSCYGYEWQGDNIVLARKNMLYTVLEFYRAKFGREFPQGQILELAKIISWNIWQMDGLKGVIPDSCVEVPEKPKKRRKAKATSPEATEPAMQKCECPGCTKKNMFHHTGKYCHIMDWEKGEPILFISLFKDFKDEYASR